MGRREAFGGLKIKVLLALDGYEAALDVTLVDSRIRKDLAVLENRLVYSLRRVGEGHSRGSSAIVSVSFFNIVQHSCIWALGPVTEM